MRSSRHHWLADGTAASSAVMLVVAEVLSYRADPSSLLRNLLSGLTFVAGFGGVGWLLWRRLPHNPIGWCFSLAGLTGAAASLAHGWATLALTRPDPPGTLVRVFALVDSYSWTVAVPLALPLPLLLLPDGMLPSRRWRGVLIAVVLGCAVGAVGFLTAPDALAQGPYRHLANPLALAALDPLRPLLVGIGQVAPAAGTGLAVVSLVLRFRRSHGLERQQLRWVALGGCCAAVGLAFGAASGVVLPDGVSVAVELGLFAVPVCVGVAVLRYRLYELGRLVSRTVSYAVVTTSLLAVYSGSVTASTRVLPDGSPVAVAASTLAAAALFQPLRRRVQDAVDRRFNHARYDADRTVEAFRRRLREEVDLRTVRTDLLEVVQQTLQPKTVGLWLRSGPLQ